MNRLSQFISGSFHWGIPLLLGILGIALAFFLSVRLDWAVFDTFSLWTANQEARHSTKNQSPVVLVLMDDASIERLKTLYGLPPWPRSAYVDILKSLQKFHPAVTVMDGHFMSFQREDDRENFDALLRIPHLVMGLLYQPDNTPMNVGLLRQNLMENQVANYYLLNLGVVNIQPNQLDGKLRSVQPIWKPSRRTAGIYPSLSLMAALEYLRGRQASAGWVLDWQESPEPALVFLSERSPNKSRLFPLQEDGTLLLHWERALAERDPRRADLDAYGLDVSHPSVPLWQVIQPENARMTETLNGQLEGKIVVFGAASSLHNDFHQTPMSLHHVGADIQATAIDNLLGLTPVRPFPFWATPLLSAIFLLGAFVLRLNVRQPEKCFLYTFGSMVIYAWIAYWMFYRHHLWLPVATPEIFILLGFLLANVWLSLMQDKEVTLLEGHLSRLVSRSVFREIRQMSSIIKQGGRKLEITAMMVDIRNFTSLAENLPPKEVSDLLNEFYEMVLGIVFSYRGTVDKFLGDGVMILYGAPVPDANHAEDALVSALEIIRQGQSLTSHWKETRGVDTEIGISIHSGNAFVGFIGPKTKLEYTAIGDTINLCARLQETAKQQQSQIIVSALTVDAYMTVLHRYPERAVLEHFQSLGEVSVRGREMPVNVWELADKPPRE